MASRGKEGDEEHGDGNGEGEIQLSLSSMPLNPPPQADDDGRPTRQGTHWTALAHLITGVSGAGVLSLPWSLSQIGWVAGPIVFLMVGAATLSAGSMFTDCYRHPDPVSGKRSYTYSQSVRSILGKRQAWMCGAAQCIELFGTTVAYTIVAAISVGEVAKSICIRRHAENIEDCGQLKGRYMIMFGGTQLLASQVRSIHGLAWLSTASTVLVMSYSPLLLGLSAVRAFERGHSHGSAFGSTLGGDTLSKIKATQKIVGVLQAIGNICFSYTFAGVQIEIQDTLKAAPPENKSMRKVIFIGIAYTTLNYIAIASAGYAAYGNSTPGNIVTALESFQHIFWLVDLVNIFIILQLIGAYQVLAQPIFAFVEDYAASCIFFCLTDSSKNKIKFLEKISVKRGLNLYSFWISRAIWRALYVIFTTVIAMRVPYLNSVLGLIGAMVYWPTTIYFPLQMYIKQHNIEPRSAKWIALQLFIYTLLIISCCCVGGSVQGMLQTWKSNKVFPF